MNNADAAAAEADRDAQKCDALAPRQQRTPPPPPPPPFPDASSDATQSETERDIMGNPVTPVTNQMLGQKRPLEVSPDACTFPRSVSCKNRPCLCFTGVCGRSELSPAAT